MKRILILLMAIIIQFPLTACRPGVEPNANPTRQNLPDERAPDLHLHVWWKPNPKKRWVEIDWSATGTNGGSVDQYISDWSHTIKHWHGGDAVILTRLLEKGEIWCEITWGDFHSGPKRKEGLGGDLRCEIHPGEQVYDPEHA